MRLSREILRLAGPSILANITVPLVGMVDMAVVGHLPGSAAALIGGITVGTMLFDLLYWNFAFLRSGTGGLTAQAFGRGERADGILRRALRIALASGVALIALQWAVVWLAFLVVDCSPEVRELATRYFHIRIWAAPATLSLFAFKGWFIGEQDSVRSMTADLLVNGLNILLSLGLGFGFRPGGITLLPALGFSGVALGTVLAQWSGFAYCLWTARSRYGFKACSVSNSQSTKYANPPLRFDRGENQYLIDYEQVTNHAQLPQGSFFRLNRDLFLRSVGMIAVYIGFTVISAGFGDVLLAVSAILMKFLMIFSYFSDGFAYAGEALTGRFIGERSLDGVKSAIRGCFAWGWGVAALFMLVYGLGGMPFLHLMTDDPQVLQAGRSYLPWLLVMPLIGCPAFIWDGIFIGATASRDLRNSTLLCAVGFFAVWLLGARFVGTHQAALHLLMVAYFMHLAIRALFLTVRNPEILRFAQNDNCHPEERSDEGSVIF